MLDFSQTGAIDRSEDIMMQIDSMRQRDWESLYAPVKLVGLPQPHQLLLSCHGVADVVPYLVWI